MTKAQEDMAVMLGESKKKTAQIATAGLIALLVFGFGAFGAVKLFPLTSQITRLVDTVDQLELQASAYGPTNVTVERLREEQQRLQVQVETLSGRVAEDEAVDSNLRLIVFPETMQGIRTELAELRDIAGDAAGDLERLHVDVDENTRSHVEQKARANTRAGERLVRDGNIARNQGRLDELERMAETMLQAVNGTAIMAAQISYLEDDVKAIENWRSTLQVGREEILQDQIRAMQAEISAIKSQIAPP